MFKTPKAVTIIRVHWRNQATGPHCGAGIILQDPYEGFRDVPGKCKAMCRPTQSMLPFYCTIHSYCASCSKALTPNFAMFAT